MKNLSNAIVGTFGSLISAIGISISSETLDHIVSMICAVIGLLITTITCLIIPIIKWYKNARKDGKIDVEELDDLSHIIQDGKNEIDKHNQDKWEERREKWLILRIFVILSKGYSVKI